MKFRKILAAAAALCIAVPAAIAGQAAALDPAPVKGDVNSDFIFNLADVVMYQRWLRGAGKLLADTNGDVNGDGVCDVLDLSAMRKLLIDCMTTAPTPNFAPKAQNLCAGIASSKVTESRADEKFINSQTTFTVELFKQAYAENEDHENALISPYSVMQALSMTANGAAGDTRTEMENVLGGGMPMEELNQYLLSQRKRSINPEYNDYNKWQMSTANSIWAIDDKSRIDVRPEFIQNCVDYYDSEFYIAPFDKTTLDDVNGWVNDKTHEMIPSILDHIGDNDVMYLVNAVAFEAEWMEPFMDYQINKGEFTSYNGEIQKADMLCSWEHYIGDENTNGMVKAYSGGRYEFAALLPDESMTIDQYIEELTPEKLNGLLTQKNYDIKADIKLPKFSYDYENELSGELESMGMPTAFSDDADFTNMSSIADRHPLHIDRVIHKTFIDLDENGTKAAAATLVAMVDGEAMAREIKEVNFDRPFVYCIFDAQTYVPVFIGAVNSLS